MSWRNAVNPGSMSKEDVVRANIDELRQREPLTRFQDRLGLDISLWQLEMIRKSKQLERVSIIAGHKIGKHELMRRLYSDQGEWIVHGPNR